MLLGRLKSDAPTGWRRNDKAMPSPELNSLAMTFERAASSSALNSSHADDSVIDAPKPTIR